MKPRSVPSGTTSIRFTKAVEIAEKHAEHVRGFSTPEKFAEQIGVSVEIARELFADIRRSTRAACLDAIRDVIEVDMTPLTAHPETAR